MPRAMNILMLSDVYFPRVNGVSTSIETFRHDLMDMGHHVQLVAPSYDAPAAGGSDPNIARIAGRIVPRDPEDRLMRWRSLRRKLAQLSAEPWDVVHVHTPFLAHGAGLQFAGVVDAPLVITYHTLFEEMLQHYVPLAPSTMIRAMAREMSRRQCQEAEAVIVPSRMIAYRLHHYGVSPRLLHVLPTGLPQRSYDPGDGAGFRRAHGISPDRPVALYVGRVSPEKNLGFLLESLAVARKRVPGILMLLAGDGPAVESLHRDVQRLRLQDQVRLLGYVSRGKPLADCYAAADVFAFASKSETQGLVLLEAMAQGVPVLALAEMGTREVLEGCAGAIIGSDHSEVFGMQLAELLARPRDRARLAAAGREWAERWRGPVLAQRLAELYRGLAERRGGTCRRKEPARWLRSAISA